MKAKTISKLLRKTFDDFCESITDERVQKLVRKNSIITGGSIASMLLNERVSDYDIYFTDQQTAEAVARYYVEDDGNLGLREGAQVIVGTGKEHTSSHRPHYDDDRVWIYIPSVGVAGDPQPGIAGEVLGDDLTEAPIEPEGEPEYRPVFLSANAITLTDKIQLIIRFHGSPDAIHENYDFAHCTNYWVSQTGQLVLRPDAIEALLTKELRYIGSKYPVCSIIRTRKFISRGFTITAGQYLKMILQCNELNLFDRHVLEDQLIGVDSAYFMQLLSAVSDTSPEAMNSAYLGAIIDKIF